MTESEQPTWTPRPWVLALAALAMTSLTGCDVLVDILRIFAIIAIVVTIVLGVFFAVGVITLLGNIVAALRGKGSARWGVAGLVVGCQSMLISFWAIALETSTGLNTAGVTALGLGAPLLILGWLNVQKEKELNALAKQSETAQAQAPSPWPLPPPPGSPPSPPSPHEPPPPPPPPKLAPPWP